MKILFRVDASPLIGTGHLMRCITLASEANRRAWKVCIVLRDPSKDILKFVQSTGYETKVLNTNRNGQTKSANTLAHSEWLPVSQEIDAMETLAEIYRFKPNWLVVDHYALDATWHGLVRPHCEKIMVIDDLGDRHLKCDLILDQNFGASPNKYLGKIAGNCDFLLGPKFALLKAEFKDWRQHSIKSRANRSIKEILITMGGVDFPNYTQKVLRQLDKSKYAKKCHFTVVTGSSYPHLTELNDYVEFSELKITVLTDVNNMAAIMSRSDLCIGAAGSTSWERCCLGLPTIMLSIADNQNLIAKHLSDENLAVYSSLNDLKFDFDKFFSVLGQKLSRVLSSNSSVVCDALGASRVIQQLMVSYEN